MLAFEDLIQQQALSRVKLATNAIEQAFAHGQRRQVNIDPGYLLLERFVLATGKNFSHRIYIGDAIYADLTLIYQKGGFQTLPWTYPDYAAAEMHLFLSQVRNTYAQDLKSDPGQARWRGRINEMAALTHETLNKRSDLC
jgi:ribosomal silencing factor RsfS